MLVHIIRVKCLFNIIFSGSWHLIIISLNGGRKYCIRFLLFLPSYSHAMLSWPFKKSYVLLASAVRCKQAQIMIKDVQAAWVAE